MTQAKRYIINVQGAIYRDNQYLISKRSEHEDFMPGIIGLAGGKIEATDEQADDVLLATLAREIHEEVTTNGTRLVRYPNRDQTQRQASYEPVKIQQVWFNRLMNFGFGGTMKEVESARRTQSKQEVRFLASRSVEQDGFLGQKLRVGERYFGSRLVRVFEDDIGTVFGVIHKENAEQYQLGDEVVLRQAKGADGNIAGMVERSNVR